MVPYNSAPPFEREEDLEVLCVYPRGEKEKGKRQQRVERQTRGTARHTRTLSKEETRAIGRRVLVAHLVELAREHGGSTEEDADVGVIVLLCDAREDAIPVGAAKVRGGAEGSDSVLLRADVLHEDVRHVVVLDLGGQVDVDLDTVLHVLLLDGVQERVEPLGGAKVADHPREVNLCSACSAFATARRSGHGTLERRVGLELLKLFIRYQIDLRILEQIISKYGSFQPPSPDSRGERRDTDTGADEQHCLVLQKVFRGRAERTIDHDAGQHAVQGRIRARANDLAAWVLLALLALLVKVAAECLGKVAREIADDTNVHRDVVFLGSAAGKILAYCVGGRRKAGNIPGERKGVPLEVGDLRAADEDVLACTSGRLLLLDLNLHHIGRVLDHL